MAAIAPLMPERAAAISCGAANATAAKTMPVQAPIPRTSFALAINPSHRRGVRAAAHVPAAAVTAAEVTALTPAAATPRRNRPVAANRALNRAQNPGFFTA